MRLRQLPSSRCCSASSPLWSRVERAANEFERNHHGLLALMSIYGIELLADNVAECREALLAIFTGALGLGSSQPAWTAAARAVLELNIVHGDALSMTTLNRAPSPPSR